MKILEYTKEEEEQTEQLFLALDDLNANFVLVPWGSKDPGRKGWQNEPLRFGDIDIGQNIGILMNHSPNVLVIDLDDRADWWLEQIEWLKDVPAVYRESADHKLKLVFENKTTKGGGRFDIKANGGANKEGELFIGGGSSGSQALIYGQHNEDPDLYKVRDVNGSLPAMDDEKLNDLWQTITGESFGGTKGKPKSGFRKGRVEGPDRIPKGSRNDTLFRIGSSWRNKGFDQNHILAALEVENEDRCDPPLEWSELESIAESVSKYSPADANPEDFTDVGNADRFAENNRGGVRYAKGLGWLVYKGGRWFDGADLKVTTLAKKEARSLFSFAASARDSADAQKWANWAKVTMSHRGIHAMLDLAKSELEIEVDDLDSHPTLLNVANGIVDLETGDLLDHAPEYLLTQQAKIYYDESAICPRWLASLDLVFQGNAEIIDYLQMALGWSISGRSDIKPLFFMYGASGNNGKSTIMETITELLGGYAHTTDIQTIMAGRRSALNPQLAAFRGKRLVVTSETESGQTWNTRLLKNLTGNDTISVNPKYKDPFEFKPNHTLWVYGNDKPEVDDTGDPFWSRMKTIPFNYSIPESEQRPMQELIAEFMEEAPGILNWLIEGYQKAAAGGITKNEPDAVRETVNEYRLENDPLEEFLEEKCERANDKKVPKSSFTTAFNEWCSRNGIDKKTPHWLTKELRQKGIERGGDGRKYYIGVELITIGRSYGFEKEKEFEM